MCEVGVLLVAAAVLIFIGVRGDVALVLVVDSEQTDVGFDGLNTRPSGLSRSADESETARFCYFVEIATLKLVRLDVLQIDSFTLTRPSQISSSLTGVSGMEAKRISS